MLILSDYEVLLLYYITLYFTTNYNNFNKLCHVLSMSFFNSDKKFLKSIIFHEK